MTMLPYYLPMKGVVWRVILGDPCESYHLAYWDRNIFMRKFLLIYDDMETRQWAASPTLFFSRAIAEGEGANLVARNKARNFRVDAVIIPAETML